MTPISDPVPTEALTVTQADRDAAASLIERYWPNNPSMHQLAASYRAGRSRSVWAEAFARHRLTTSSAPSSTEGDRPLEMAWREGWALCKESAILYFAYPRFTRGP